MNSKQQNTLEMIFKCPVQFGVYWSDVEALFKGLGGHVSEGRSSRIRVALYGARAVFHKPHPGKEIDKGALVSIGRFLENAGVHT